MKLKNLKLKVYKEFNPEIEKIWEDFEKNSHNYFFQTLNWQKEWFHSIIRHNKNYSINIEVDISAGKKDFTVYTMDLTKKYIEINADYRS